MHEHLSRELFRAIHKGWRNPGDLAAIAMAHLFELCPHCRSEFETWRSELGEGVTRDEGDYDDALQKIRERTAANDLGPEGETARVERERREAKSRAEELLALPDGQRLDWIRNERTRHSGVLLAEALIEECRRKTPGHPREGYVLADLARVTLHHAPVTAYAAELYGLALARLANAVRVIGDLPRAEQIVADAQYFLRSQSGSSRLVRAEVDGLVCSLLIGRERTDEAIKLGLRASMAYRLEGEVRGSVMMLIKLARAHAKVGQYSRAVDHLESCERQVEISDTRLQALIRLNQAAYFSKLGYFDQAAEWLAGGLELLQGQDEITPLRCLLILHDIRRGRKDLDGAESSLLEARVGFELRELSYDSALCGHSLAWFYAQQGRRWAALEEVERALPVFQQLGLVNHVASLQELRQKWD